MFRAPCCTFHLHDLQKRQLVDVVRQCGSVQRIGRHADVVEEGELEKQVPGDGSGDGPRGSPLRPCEISALQGRISVDVIGGERVGVHVSVQLTTHRAKEKGRGRERVRQGGAMFGKNDARWPLRFEWRKGGDKRKAICLDCCRMGPNIGINDLNDLRFVDCQDQLLFTLTHV